MCEWLAFLMLVFGCEMCGVECHPGLNIGFNYGYNISVELDNECPVKGVQFTIRPPNIISCETTSRTDGFFAQWNKDSGQVILLSLSGDKINPGTGPILELIPDRPDCNYVISGIKIIQ